MDMPEVPDEVKREVRAVLLSKIGGVKIIDFERDFKALSGKPLRYRQCGFPDMASLIEAMPDVAKLEWRDKDKQMRIFGVNDPNCYMPTFFKKAEAGGPEPRERNRRTSRGGSSYDNRNGIKQYQSHGQQQNNVNIDQRPLMFSTKNTEWDKHISCNAKGFYSICIPKKFDVSQQDIGDAFSVYGEVVEIGETKNYWFVRYSKKEQAVEACTHLFEKFRIRPASEKTTVQKAGGKKYELDEDSARNPQHSGNTCFNCGQSGHMRRECPGGDARAIVEIATPKKMRSRDTVEVFLGNLPNGVDEDTIRKLLASYASGGNLPIKIRMGNNENRFCFVRVEKELANQMIRELHRTKLQGKTIVVDLAHKDTGTHEKSSARNVIRQNDQGGVVLQDLNYDSSSSEEDFVPKAEAYDGGANHASNLQQSNNVVRNNYVYDDDDDDDDEMPGLEVDEDLMNELLQDPQKEVNGFSPPRNRVPNSKENRYRKTSSSSSGKGSSLGDQPDSQNKLEVYVGNLPIHTSKQELMELMQDVRCNPIGIHIVTNDDQTATYAFVRFSNSHDLMDAYLNLDNCNFKGRKLTRGLGNNTKKEDINVKFDFDFKVTSGPKGRTFKKHLLEQKPVSERGQLQHDSGMPKSAMPNMPSGSQDNQMHSVPIVRPGKGLLGDRPGALDQWPHSHPPGAHYPPPAQNGLMGMHPQWQPPYGGYAPQFPGPRGPPPRQPGPNYGPPQRMYNYGGPPKRMYGVQTMHNMQPNRPYYQPRMPRQPRPAQQQQQQQQQQQSPASLDGDIQPTTTNSTTQLPSSMLLKNVSKMYAECFPEGTTWRCSSDFPDILGMVVTEVANKDYFWAIPPLDEEEIGQYQWLDEKLQSEDSLKPYDNQLRQTKCAAPHDGAYYRAWIMESKHKDSVMVLYIDYGNVGVVNVADIRSLDEELWSMPPQVVPFKRHSGLVANPLEKYNAEVIRKPGAEKNNVILVILSKEES